MPPRFRAFFNIPVDHLVGAPILANYFREFIAQNGGSEDFVVVSPDLGSVTRAKTSPPVWIAPLRLWTSAASAPTSAR